MKLVILAAGMGSRFGGLKQMEPMDEYGHFILDYSVYDAIENGFSSVIFVIKKEMYEDFKNIVGKRFEGKIKIEYVFQELSTLPDGYTVPDGRCKPWGTGHALWCARKYLDEDYVMINSDDYYGKESFKVAKEYLDKTNRKENEFANVVFNVSQTMTDNGSVKRGVCFSDKDGNLNEMIESNIEEAGGLIHATPLDGRESFIVNSDAMVSMNFFIFTPSFTKYLDKGMYDFLDKSGTALKSEYLLPDLVGELSRKKIIDVKLIKTPSKWYGVTYKEDKAMVVEAFKKYTNEGLYKKGF